MQLGHPIDHQHALQAGLTWHQLLNGKHNVNVANDVVVLGEDSPLAVDHGVGGAALLAKVHNGIWLEGGDCLGQELPVADVADLQRSTHEHTTAKGRQVWFKSCRAWMACCICNRREKSVLVDTLAWLLLVGSTLPMASTP